MIAFFEEKFGRMPRKRKTKRSRRTKRKKVMIFEKHNYVLLALCVAAIATGFVLMRIENQLEGVISLYVSPLMIMAGYIGVMYAIMWMPKGAASGETTV